jgi:hypothetical protein
MKTDSKQFKKNSISNLEERINHKNDICDIILNEKYL